MIIKSLLINVHCGTVSSVSQASQGGGEAHYATPLIDKDHSITLVMIIERLGSHARCTYAQGGYQGEDQIHILKKAFCQLPSFVGLASE